MKNILFSETVRIGKKQMPSTKEECIKKQITHVRVAWDDTHPWINIESLNPGKIKLHTSNVMGKDFWVDEIIGKTVRVWQCDIVEKDFIDRPVKVRKIKEVKKMPESYTLHQSGFQFI